MNSEFLVCLPNGETSITSGTNKALTWFISFEDTLSVLGFNEVPVNTIITKRDVLHNVVNLFNPLRFFHS